MQLHGTHGFLELLHGPQRGEHVLRYCSNGLTDTIRPGASCAGRWRRLVVAGFAVFSVALVLSGPLSSAVHAADDEEEEESLESKFIKKFLGIDNRGAIDYRERPPLVVPPNLGNLPRPETNRVANTPAWPKDPEEVERKKRAAAKKNQRRRASEEDDRPLTPAELDAPGRRVGAGRVGNPTGPQDAESEGWRMMRPNELGSSGNLLGSIFKDPTKPDVAEFKGEPTRSDLTQPPPGYRTPSAAHPYGLSKRQEKAKPFDLSTIPEAK